MDRELPHNAVSLLILRGLATDSSGQSSVPLHIHPGKRVPGIVYQHSHPLFNNSALPEIPPGDLPDAENLQLELTLSEMISAGADGFVYSCVVDEKCSAATSHYIPPLVIKIARARRAYSAAREAWFYDKMESLQGVIIPRCYGFFVAEVPDNLRISAWGKTGTLISGQDDAEEQRFPFAEPFQRTSFDFNRCQVSILVLEKLGDPLPENKIPNEVTGREIEQMYHELESRGILHVDVSTWNILSVPQTALPGKPSGEGVVHNWRITDFCKAAGALTVTDYNRRFHRNAGLDNLFTEGHTLGELEFVHF